MDPRNPLFPEWDEAAKRLAEDRREEAMARVERNAPVSWRGWAETAVRYVAERRSEFTTDPVWTVLESWAVPTPPEPRALGPLMRSVQTWGWCKATGSYRNSVRAANHGRPLMIYRSNLFHGNTRGNHD